jgi:general secretion pathway protein G
MSMHTEPRLRRDAGVTLIEMLIVILLIGLVSAIVAINVLQYFDRGRTEKARTDIAQLESVLELFRIDYGRYPSLEEGLAALSSPPAREAGPAAERGAAYLRGALPNDPWGRPYAYVVPGANAAYEIYSLGADGAEGGEGADADIRSGQ